MFSTLKLAHAAHVIALKVFTAKAVVGLGMIAGTAATGYVVTENIRDDYIDRALLLIDHAVGGSGGSGAALLDNGARQRRAAGPRAANNPVAGATGASRQVPRPALQPNTLSILRDGIIGRDMTAAQDDDDMRVVRQPSAGD